MLKVKITGMTCVHCEIFLKKVLSNVPGVIRVIEVSQKRGEAVLDGFPDHKVLESAVRKHGTYLSPNAGIWHGYGRRHRESRFLD